MAIYYTIDERTARTAWDMAHMSDYQEGSTTAEYRAKVDEAAALVERKKQRISEFYHPKLDGYLDAYARRLAQWYNDMSRNEASCPSVLIAGPAKFPVNKKNRQNARCETLMTEYKEIEGLLDKIRSIGTGAIDFADPHAREMLKERLDNARALQERMKAINAYYRKHKTLDGCDLLTPAEQQEAAAQLAADYIRTPYPAWCLQNNNANIKRYADRLAEYDKLHSAESQAANNEPQRFDGGEIVRNVELDRLQILFDEKPDEATRTKLKANGFRWSPRNSAWQRQLTQNAERALKAALDI